MERRISSYGEVPPTRTYPTNHRRTLRRWTRLWTRCSINIRQKRVRTAGWKGLQVSCIRRPTLMTTLAAVARYLGWFAELASGPDHSRRNAAWAVGMLTLVLCVGYGRAQTPQYIEYPLLAGKTHEYHWSSLPSWIKFDSEIRGRLDG